MKGKDRTDMPKTHAKVVCTLGPASNTPEVIGALLDAGMNVARLNFSHGSHEEHRKLIHNLRRVAEERSVVLGILLDLQGPKVRVGRFVEGAVELRPGARFTITGRDVEGTVDMVSTTYKGLANDVGEGETILLDDGLISLRVLEVNPPEVVCEVVVGGVLKNNKGINIPHAPLSVDVITEKDLADARFGVEEGVDWLAMSFVRHPSDIQAMRAHLVEWGSDLPIMAKIEKPQALDHMEAIVREADGIMVARGDLGVELPPEEVPAVQKALIAECNRQGKPVVTATQMLESMIHNPRPTRAEASDVANAILDGTDAVMLSAESASGKYPVEAVQVMKRIIQATELQHQLHDLGHRRRHPTSGIEINEAIAVSACQLAEQVAARCITCITLTGSMSRKISKHRPYSSIIAVSQFEKVLRRLVMYWGVEGILMSDLTMDIDNAILDIEKKLISLGHLSTGDFMVFTAGMPFSERLATNMVRVDRVK